MATPINANTSRIASTFTGRWTNGEKRVQSALNEAAKDGVIDTCEAKAIADRFVGTPDDFMFRYGLMNVLSDDYRAYTTIDLPKNAKLSPGARDVFEKHASFDPRVI